MFKPLKINIKIIIKIYLKYFIDILKTNKQDFNIIIKEIIYLEKKTLNNIFKDIINELEKKYDIEEEKISKIKKIYEKNLNKNKHNFKKILSLKELIENEIENKKTNKITTEIVLKILIYLNDEERLAELLFKKIRGLLNNTKYLKLDSIIEKKFGTIEEIEGYIISEIIKGLRGFRKKLFNSNLGNTAKVLTYIDRIIRNTIVNILNKKNVELSFGEITQNSGNGKEENLKFEDILISDNSLNTTNDINGIFKYKNSNELFIKKTKKYFQFNGFNNRTFVLEKEGYFIYDKEIKYKIIISILEKIYIDIRILLEEAIRINDIKKGEEIIEQYFSNIKNYNPFEVMLLKIPKTDINDNKRKILKLNMENMYLEIIFDNDKTKMKKYSDGIKQTLHKNANIIKKIIYYFIGITNNIKKEVIKEISKKTYNYEIIHYAAILKINTNNSTFLLNKAIEEIKNNEDIIDETFYKLSKRYNDLKDKYKEKRFLLSNEYIDLTTYLLNNEIKYYIITTNKIVR